MVNFIINVSINTKSKSGICLPNMHSDNCSGT